MNKEHLHPDGRPYTKEEFVEKIKTDKTFAKRFGNLGKIYGHQWRNWGKDFKQIPNETGDKVYDITTTGIDQIANLISELKTNPDSRRLLVSAWNVADVESGSMVLPPCHYGFQVYTRELSREERWDLYSNRYAQMKPYKFQKMLDGIWVESTEEEDMFEYDVFRIPKRAISLMWNQRSCDFPLGIPANIMSYALLLTMFAKQLNMVPDELIGNLGDCHIYLNQIEGVKEQLTREPYELPTVKISDRVVNDISEYTLDDIILENYQSHPAIKMPLSN